MSDYYGDATLEDWLAEEVFSVEHGKVPADVVALFERWREPVQNSIEGWRGSDKGDGPMSWRGWGRGFYSIPDADSQAFDAAIAKGKELMQGS